MSDEIEEKTPLVYTRSILRIIQGSLKLEMEYNGNAIYLSVNESHRGVEEIIGPIDADDLLAALTKITTEEE